MLLIMGYFTIPASAFLSKQLLYAIKTSIDIYIFNFLALFSLTTDCKNKEERFTQIWVWKNFEFVFSWIKALFLSLFKMYLKSQLKRVRNLPLEFRKFLKSLFFSTPY